MTNMAKLYQQNLQIYHEAVFFSGMTADALSDAAFELGADYEFWCQDYNGPDLADHFSGIEAMLREWSFPWPQLEGSSLNELSPAQFYLALAFESVRCSLSILAAHQEGGCTTDDAACESVTAAKALAHAKYLLASPSNQMAPAIMPVSRPPRARFH